MRRATFALRMAACALAVSGLPACASKVLKHKQAETILVNEEYEQALQVREIPGGSGNESGAYVRIRPEPELLPAPAPAAPAASEPKGKKAKKSKKDPAAQASSATGNPAPAAPTAPARRLPEIEDAEGFNGRRPLIDPFRVGEKVVLELSYFGVVGGDMTLEVRPFVEVNGRKSYHFMAKAASTSVFAMFYAVDDWAETFLDYEELIPFNYSLHVKETKQLREVRSYFDWKKMTGYVWDKKVTKEKGVEEKKYEWSIPSYSHNVFSAPFYIRMFKLEPGKKVQVRIGHEGKNLVMTAEVLRREKIQTALGEFNTVVIKPRIEIDGVFKPVGDIFFWMTDDDRKFIVKIESKIKIGTIVGRVKAIEAGKP